MKWALALSIAAACSAPAAPAPTGWMAAIDDSRSLTELSIPGSHETLALYEPLPGTAKCQELPLAKQLSVGIRYLDIRCRHLDDGFSIYHGPVFELQTFDDVLATVYAFLADQPTETVIMSIKEESAPGNTTRSFADTFAAYVQLAPERWYLGPAVPTLGEARGKIVVVRRFDATTTLGIDAVSWADDTTFSITDRGANLRVQDHYRVDVIDDKWAAIESLFDETRRTTSATLFLNYTSGYQTRNGLPDTPSVSSAINPRIDRRLADIAIGEPPVGVIVGDFMSETRAGTIARLNQP